MIRSSRDRLLRTHVMLVVLCIAAPARATAQEPRADGVDPQKASLIRQLLDIVGTPQLSLQALETSVHMQRTADTTIPQVFWEEFLERARNDVDRFITLMVPVYDTHYSLSDLEELIVFYQTPLGQRLLAAQPAVLQAGITAGQRWGAALGAEVAADLAARGIIIP